MSLLVRARYRRVFALLLLGAWIALCFPGPAAAAGEPKKVLILHSYHHGFPWTEGIMAGMQKVFSEAGDPPQLHVEYLDAKRYHDTEYLDHVLEGVFDHKLAGRRFDLVLLSDNDAFNYVLKHRHDLFAGTPIVFCGVNGYRPADPAAGGMTGVDDSPSFAETIELALRLHPGAEEFVFIGSTDNVPGRLFRRALEALAPRFPVRFQFWDDLPAEEIEERLGRLPANRLISIYGFVRDRSGRILPFAESCRRIREASSAPLYGFWDFFLGQGAVGGKVVSSERQGRLAAGLALRVLAGEDPDAIPVVRSGANVYMFDYPELQRFGISPESLPPGSLVLNRPPPLYSVNKEYLWAGLGIMTGLLGLSLALAWTLRLHRKVEQKLRDNARLVQTLLDAIPLSVYYMDAQGRYLGCNSAGEEFIGRSRDEVIGRTSEDLFPPEMAEQYRTADAELFRTRQIQIVENKFIGADGRDRDVQFHKAPFFDSRGNVEGLVGTILDITERKQAEQEIESLARFPQENNNPVLRIRADGSLSYVNSAGRTLLLEAGELPVGWAELAATVLGSGGSRESETESGGRIFNLNWVPVAEAGYVNVYGQDVTERKGAEQALRMALEETEAARDKIDAILKSVADGLVVTDSGGRIVLMNRAAETLLGKNFSEVISRPFEAVFADDALRRQVMGMFEGCCEEGTTEWEALDSDDAARVIQARSALTGTGGGRDAGVITILRDITREKMLGRMKDEFICTAAHELRTPLTSVLGYAEILESPEEYGISDSGQKQEFITCIRQKAERLSGIVDDLLDLARIQRGNPPALVLESCDLVGFLDRCVASYRTMATKHNLKVSLPEGPLMFRMDAAKMEQVMENLLSNAAKFSPAGTTVLVAGQRQEDGFLISVADQGVGMTPEQVERVFDKFYRGDASNTAVEGLGLGMSIARHIVEGHGGRIRVESSFGQGTTVLVWLPVT